MPQGKESKCPFNPLEISSITVRQFLPTNSGYVDTYFGRWEIYWTITNCGRIRTLLVWTRYPLIIANLSLIEILLLPLITSFIFFFLLLLLQIGMLRCLVEDTVHCNDLRKAPLINSALGITIRNAGLTRPRGINYSIFLYTRTIRFSSNILISI